MGRFFDELNDLVLAMFAPRTWERKKSTERSYQQALGNVAIRAYRHSRQMDAQEGRDIQFEDDDCRIEVKNGYHWSGDKYTTDVLVIDRHSSSGAGWHVVFDEEGNIIHQGWKSTRG